MKILIFFKKRREIKRIFRCPNRENRHQSSAKRTKSIWHWFDARSSAASPRSTSGRRRRRPVRASSDDCRSEGQAAARLQSRARRANGVAAARRAGIGAKSASGSAGDESADEARLDYSSSEFRDAREQSRAEPDAAADEPAGQEIGGDSDAGFGGRLRERESADAAQHPTKIFRPAAASAFRPATGAAGSHCARASGAASARAAASAADLSAASDADFSWRLATSSGARASDDEFAVDKRRACENWRHCADELRSSVFRLQCTGARRDTDSAAGANQRASASAASFLQRAAANLQDARRRIESQQDFGQRLR